MGAPTEVHTGRRGNFGLNTTASDSLAEYKSSRLTFKRDVIEPLDNDAVFRVVTPVGTFQMSKADFCRVFTKVRLTSSGAEGGVTTTRRRRESPKSSE